MMKNKALARCGLVLLSLWLCIQSVPISVDKTKEKPQEELEPPHSAVSKLDSLTLHISLSVLVTPDIPHHLVL